MCPNGCGCQRHAGNNVKHGDTRHYRASVEYYAWSRMFRRGYDVCPEWRSFVRFLADVGRRPSPDHMLVRIDKGAGFGPTNVEWQRRRT
jgi:hypothetical protein